jgi:hypothetical protein
MPSRGEVLRALKAELKFLEDDGYGRSPRTPWRPTLIFEDSPSCLNFDDASRPHACAECWLSEFVPEKLKDHDRPCRLIPLDADGKTVEYLYHYGTQVELEQVLGQWLRHQIKKVGAGVAGRVGLP